MSEYIFQVKELKKSFDSKLKSVRSIFDKSHLKVYAVDNVTFDVKKGEILGIIGESGCGKSTTARLLMQLIKHDKGKLLFNGNDVSGFDSLQMQEYRKKTSMVFQDPYEYLNPRQTVMDIIAEPLIVNKMIKNRANKEEAVVNILEAMDLKPAKSYLNRYTYEMSGGQMQRIAIARALVTNPEFIVADEPTSMLDVSVRAGILNLLLRLKKDMNLSMVFITHDITTAGYMCDRIAVMYKGRIVEVGDKDDIIFNPYHPYTKALVAVAINLKMFLEERGSIIKDGEVDNYIKSARCGFESRCVCSNEKCTCSNEEIELKKIKGNHYVACCNLM